MIKIATYRIYVNVETKTAFIDISNGNCKYEGKRLLDVFLCFKCKYYGGLFFGKKGVKIQCFYPEEIEHIQTKSKAINYAPTSFVELLRLVRETKSRNEAWYKIMKQYKI